MSSGYTIHPYRTGFEIEQAKIGMEASSSWFWPRLSTAEELSVFYSRQGFDPEMCLYAFLDQKMVSFVTSHVPRRDNTRIARVDFPRVLPSHEAVIDMLFERAVSVLRRKGVNEIQVRASTQEGNSVCKMSEWGLNPVEGYELGYKIYYTYNLSRGRLDIRCEGVTDFNPELDFDECVEKVSHFFQFSKERAKVYLEKKLGRDDLTGHLVVRDNDRLVAICLAHPNPIASDIVGIFHIFSENEIYLASLLSKLVANSKETHARFLLADLIGEHLFYEGVYSRLGFRSVCKFGYYHMQI
jgi:hypothetical protein